MQLESTLSRRSLSYRVTPQNTFFSTFCLAMTSSKLWSVFLSKFILSFELLNPTSILSQIKWVFFFCISFCLWHLTFAQLGANHGVRLADIFKVPTSTPHYSWFSPLQRTTTTTIYYNYILPMATYLVEKTKVNSPEFPLLSQSYDRTSYSFVSLPRVECQNYDSSCNKTQKRPI